MKNSIRSNSVDQPYGLCEFGHQGKMHSEAAPDLQDSRNRIWHTRLGWITRDPTGYPDGLNPYAGYHILRGGFDPSGSAVIPLPNPNAKPPKKPLPPDLEFRGIYESHYLLCHGTHVNCTCPLFHRTEVIKQLPVPPITGPTAPGTTLPHNKNDIANQGGDLPPLTNEIKYYPHISIKCDLKAGPIGPNLIECLEVLDIECKCKYPILERELPGEITISKRPPPIKA